MVEKIDVAKALFGNQTNPVSSPWQIIAQHNSDRQKSKS